MCGMCLCAHVSLIQVWLQEATVQKGLLNRKLRIGQRDRGCMRRRKALIAEGLGHTDGWCVTGVRAQDRAYKEKERRGVEGCMMQ